MKQLLKKSYLIGAIATTFLALITDIAAAQVESRCYRLNGNYYLMTRLVNAMSGSGPLTLTVAVQDDDTAQKSGSRAEWQAAATTALNKWPDYLREHFAQDARIPNINYVFGTPTTTPAYDVKLIIHAENVFDAPGVPAYVQGTKPKFTAFVTPDFDDIRPVIHVFPSARSNGWTSVPAARAKVQATLLNHEAGHAWGMLDLYNSAAVTLTPLPGFEKCRAQLMYAPRDLLGAGDKAGIEPKFLNAIEGGGGLRAMGFPGTSSDAFEDGRLQVDFDDPIFGAPIVVSTGGYLLDGFGGVTAFGGAPSPNLAGAPYWAGWDIARALTMLPDASGGWILDGWGGIHNFGAAPPISTPAYWPNWDIARDLVVLARPGGGYMGYVLDGWGGLHPFGGAPSFPQQNQRLQPGQYSAAMVFHAGQDSAVGLTLTYDTPGLNLPTGGMVLERTGMLTRFGLYGVPGDYHYVDSRFPLLSRSVAWRKFTIVDGSGFYATAPAQAATGYQNVLQAIGTPDPLSVPNLWGAWDIIRDVTSYRPGCVPTSSPNCLQ